MKNKPAFFIAFILGVVLPMLLLHMMPTVEKKEYKSFKCLRKESLRDNMSDIEIALADIGELTTRELAKKHKPVGLEENRKVAKEGGEVAKNTRMDIERKLGESVITNNNSLVYEYIEEDKQIEMK